MAKVVSQAMSEPDLVRVLDRAASDINEALPSAVGDKGLDSTARRTLLDRLQNAVRELSGPLVRKILHEVADAVENAKDVSSARRDVAAAAFAARLAVHRAAVRLDDASLTPLLVELDASLESCGPALLAIEDSMYHRLTSGRPVSDHAWWGFRELLTDEELVHLLRSAHAAGYLATERVAPSNRTAWLWRAPATALRPAAGVAAFLFSLVLVAWVVANSAWAQRVLRTTPSKPPVEPPVASPKDTVQFSFDDPLVAWAMKVPDRSQVYSKLGMYGNAKLPEKLVKTIENKVLPGRDDRCIESDPDFRTLEFLNEAKDPTGRPPALAVTFASYPPQNPPSSSYSRCPEHGRRNREKETDTSGTSLPRNVHAVVLVARADFENKTFRYLPTRHVTSVIEDEKHAKSRTWFRLHRGGSRMQSNLFRGRRAGSDLDGDGLVDPVYLSLRGGRRLALREPAATPGHQPLLSAQAWKRVDLIIFSSRYERVGRVTAEERAGYLQPKFCDFFRASRSASRSDEFGVVVLSQLFKPHGRGRITLADDPSEQVRLYRDHWVSSWAWIPQDDKFSRAAVYGDVEVDETLPPGEQACGGGSVLVDARRVRVGREQASARFCRTANVDCRLRISGFTHTPSDAEASVLLSSKMPPFEEDD